MQNRIDEVLKKQGKTYKDLVPLTGLSEYGIGKMAQASDDEDLGAWFSLARALHVSPAYLVGWSDEPNDEAWFKEHLAEKLKMELSIPAHGVKVTLDDGRIIYASREMDDIMNAYTLAGDWVHLNDCRIAKSHIVSIEKVGDES